MATRLIIDGNDVYEIDEECMEYRKKREGQRKKETRERQNTERKGKEQ